MPGRESRAFAEHELIRLSHDFAYYMDYRLYPEVVQLFTSDALFDRILHVHRGHEEIMAGLKARGDTIVTRHVTTNFHFDHISDREVRGVVYNISYHGVVPESGELPVSYGDEGMLMDFHDRYQLTDNGWRFAERVARPVLLPTNSPMHSAKRFWRPADFI